MSFSNSFVDLYRLSTKNKVGSARLLCYVALGLVISGEWFRLECVVDLIVVTGGVLFATLLNDYYDHVLHGEPNAVGDLLERKDLSKGGVLILTWVPWLIALATFVLLTRFPVSTASLVMLWLSFLLSWGYSQPPIRLKERGIPGILAPPIGIFMLYLQALILVKSPDAFSLTISVSVFLYTWHLDFLHLAADAVTKHETPRLGPRAAMTAVRITASIGVVAAAVCVVFNGWMIVSVLAWTCRWLAVRDVDCDDVAASRKSMLSGIYRIEEFAILAAVSVLL